MRALLGRGCAAALVLIGAAALAAGSPAGGQAETDDGWPMFRGNPMLTGVASRAPALDLEPVWVFEVAEGIESTAAIHGDTVYVGGLDGVLYALALDSGELRWKYEAGEGIKSSPAVHGGGVFFGDEGGTFHAVDATSGKLLWRFETEAEIVSSANFAGERVLFGSHDESLYCLSVKDGSLVWRVETGGYVYGTPAVAGETVISAGCDGYLRIVALSDGTELRKIELGGYVGASPAVRGGRAYVGTFENEVLALNLENGAVLWRFEDEKRKFPFLSSAAVRDGLVVIGGRDKRLRALAAATGEQRWSYTTRGKIDSSPVIAGDRVYVAPVSGEIFALSLESGDVLWSFDTGSAFVASPGIAAGRLVIGTVDGQLYCFGTNKEGTRGPSNS